MIDASRSSGTNGEPDSDLRLTLIGPLPPPVDGQSVVMKHMLMRLAPHFPRIRVADTTERSAGGLQSFILARRAARVWLSVKSLWLIKNSDVVYIAVKAGSGMWLTSATAGAARLFGARVFLHHHSYTYIRTRKLRMVALARIAGSRAHHIVLSRTMARDLIEVMPEIGEPLIIGNACLVDQSLLGLSLKGEQKSLVLGHLSNLTPEKGISEAVDLAIALHRCNVPVKLIVGGPESAWGVRVHLDRAAKELGDLFEYRGSLNGEAKLRFFDDITHFIFPTRYRHEAVPLVLYEAMAAGAVCVATRHGSIPEQLHGGPSILAATASSFVQEVVPLLSDLTISTSESADSRQAFIRALRQSEYELDSFVRLLRGDEN